MSQYGVGPAISGGSGTVTSVAIAAPAIFSISGSPVTTTGTLTLTLAAQSGNVVFASPANGSSAAPAFRALVAADIPAIDAGDTTYSPANPAYWDVTPPATIAEALDRLAGVASNSGAVPIP